MSNKYNVCFNNRGELIETREIYPGFIENSFPKHKSFEDHISVGWKTDGKTRKEIWPGDKFYIIDESCIGGDEYSLPLNVHQI